MTDVMPPNVAPLYLVHIPLRLNELARFAQNRGRGLLIRRRKSDGRERASGLDEGRALHHLLDETFGPAVLRPFRLMVSPGQSGASLYAYTQAPEAELRATAEETAPPESSSVLDLDRLASKKMLASWSKGRRLAFDIRIRPVVRIKSSLPNARQPDKPYNPGAELDAFLVEAQRRFPNERPRITDDMPVPGGMVQEKRRREAVYRDWLARRLAPAARIDAKRTHLVHFRRTRVARNGPAPEGPDAILHGELVIEEPEPFADLLTRGIGRHKAYGYGMLLLRPAPSRVALP